MNLALKIHEVAVAYGSKPAIIYEGKNYSYADIDKEVGRYAVVLKQLGIGVGDRVAFQLDKCMEFIFLHLANMSIGGVTLPLNSGYKTDEVEYFISDSGSSLFITDGERYRAHQPMLKKLGVKTVLINSESEVEVVTLSTLLEAAEAETKHRDFPSADDDVAIICYTSGTTGLSKGAMITHRNLIANMVDLKNIWQWTENDILLHILPLFHVHGLFVALHGSLNAGSTVIMHERFEPGRVWKTLAEENCTLMMGVPTIYQRLVNEWDKLPNKPDLSEMRVFISGSAPLSVNLFARFEDATGFRILERYGMTETGMNTSNSYYPAGRKPGSVGFPLPGVSLKIVDGKGREVVPGEVGEVLLKGDNVFKGYWQMPEKTMESFVDGWFRSGDLGYQDPYDGMRIYLAGRSKELIITGGYNVYPKEIETVLETHTAVKECAVMGLPDEDFGEKVTAVIVLKEGFEKADPVEIITFCKVRLAAYKCPKTIQFIDELPRNAMGKMQKNQLIEMFK